MVTTEKLETILEKCQIILEFAPLPPSILGYYYCDGEYYIILINKSIENNERLYRTVLAEEIGHYRTTIGDKTPRTYMCYRDRLEVDRHELRALKWATDFLVPTGMLLDYIGKQISVVLEDLADYFYVTYDFILMKFEFMAKQKPVWDMGGQKSLLLYSLPSVYIYENVVDY